MKSQMLRGSKLTLITLLVCLVTTAAWAKPRRVLVVSVTAGFRHSSIETAQRTLKALGEKDGGFAVVDVADTGPRPKANTPEEAAWLERTKKVLAETMSADAMKQYDGIIFANTTLDLPMPNPQDLIDFVRAGKAFIAMHSGSDTFHSAPGKVSPYVDMLGGEFLTHGAQVTVECINQDPAHPRRGTFRKVSGCTTRFTYFKTFTASACTDC
jgi:hypothetical protein